MKFLNIFVAAIIINLSTCLIILKNSTLNKDYKFGGVSNLYLSLSESIFFTSQNDIFGFLNPENGLITSIYELEGNEKIVRFYGTD